MEGKKVIFMALLVFLFMIAVPLSTSGVEGQIEIVQTLSTTFPILLDEPGNYLLMSDLTVSAVDTNCLQITADEVILDLNGYTLSGPGKGIGSSGCGILACGQDCITIRNGTIQGFFTGLTLSGTSHEVKNLNVLNNTSCGLVIESAALASCTAANNGSHGIEAESCTIKDCTASYNGACGLSSNSSNITNYTADHNSSHGISATGNCRLEGCILSNNQGYGLSLHPDYSYVVRNGTSANVLGSFSIDGFHYLPTSGDDANYEF
ncbi:MAG: right-handed parallel beta-helix repeat-containing protein [bacterium]